MTATPNLTADAEVSLAATSTVGLLTAHAALTHRLDAARRNLTSRERLTAYRAIRAQRDAVVVEILRRTGDA